MNIFEKFLCNRNVMFRRSLRELLRIVEITIFFVNPRIQFFGTKPTGFAGALSTETTDYIDRVRSFFIVFVLHGTVI